MIVVADSGGANIASVMYALERLRTTATLTSNPADLETASGVILPGVGAAADAMKQLKKNGLADIIPQLRVPVLGICLGMQLLFEASEEGDVECLGVIPGVAKRFDADMIVPHMGWAPVTKSTDSPLLHGIDDGAYFYFLHSFALPVGAATVATADHGGKFTAMARKGNFIAAQCHPERSGDAGARLLANFVGATAGAAACG